MSSTGLRYLLESINSGSMRAASDKLNVAPSSISRQIALLEVEYGLALIEKGRRGIVLTQAGEIVVAHYRHQLADREALRAKIEDLRSVRSGQVSFAVGEGFLGAAFTAMINAFTLEYPKIKVDLTVGSSQDILRMVTDDEAHVGLVFQAPHDVKINVRSVVSQPLMAIVSPDHPIASWPSVRLSALQDYPLCLAPRNFRIRQILADAEAHTGVHLAPTMSTNSIFVMREAALAGSAITILPEIPVWAELQSGKLIGIPFEEDLADTSLALILRAGRVLEGAPRRLLNAVDAHMRQWKQNS